MNSKVGEVEEQRLLVIMPLDDVLRLPGEDVRGVVTIIFPGHAHMTTEVITPSILKIGITHHMLTGRSSDEMYRFSVIIGVIIVVLLAEPVARVRFEPPECRSVGLGVVTEVPLANNV